RRCRGMIKAELVEGPVWQAVTGVLRQPAILRAKLDDHGRALGARAVEIRSEAEHLSRQLAALERQERQLLDLYLDEKLRTEAVTERLQAVVKQRESLRAHLAQVDARIAAHGAEEARQESVERVCRQIVAGLDRLDAPGRQKLLRLLVDEI